MIRRVFIFIVIAWSLQGQELLAGGRKVYVSPGGSDSGKGSLSSPFRTLERARDELRRRRAEGEVRPLSVIMRGGDYYFDRTAVFDEQDSALTIRPHKKERVRFTGGITVDPGKVKPVAGSRHEQLFPERIREHIGMVNLREEGIDHYGWLNQVGFGHPLVPSGMELFINGKSGHLSRWPNDSVVPVGTVLERGSVSVEGDHGNQGGCFAYAGDRPSGWKSPDDIWIFGYFKYGWADDAVRLAKIDTAARTFTTAQPHLYGYSSGKPWNTWYAYNIPEETDVAGEYYIDRREGLLYFYRPDTLQNLEVSMLEKPFMAMRGASSVIVRDITFECSRGPAVEMESCNGCLLRNCVLRNLGLYAVQITDAENGPVGKGNGVKYCHISETGAGGVRLFGGDRNALDSASNFVENCRIHDFNRITKTYCAGVKIGGSGNRIIHCEIFRAPHTAILLSGNDHLIEYNEIHDVCQSTEDVGALYYGRNPSERGHLVRYNYFHHIGSDMPHVSAVYHDDGACGMRVFGNVFYKAGTWPSLIGGGNDNPYINNIFIDCPVGICIDNRLQNWAKDWLNPGGLFEKVLNDVNYKQPPFSVRYPEISKYWEEDPGFPKRNKVDKNVFVRVEKPVRGDRKWLTDTGNNLEFSEDPGFMDEQGGNFMLKKSSVIFKKLPGFRSVPFNEMGTE